MHLPVHNLCSFLLLIVLFGLISFSHGNYRVDATKPDKARRNRGGARLLPKNQIALLVKAIDQKFDPFPTFPAERFPVLYEVRQSSFVLNHIRRCLPVLNQYAREQLSKFPFYQGIQHQLRAILVYPRTTNQYSRPKYLEWVRTTLPLFLDPHNWPRLWVALDRLAQLPERLPAIFLDETEEALYNQYCCYLASSQRYRPRLKELLPALKLGRTFPNCPGWDIVDDEEDLNLSELLNDLFEGDSEVERNTTNYDVEKSNAGQLSSQQSINGNNNDKEENFVLSMASTSPNSSEGDDWYYNMIGDDEDHVVNDHSSNIFKLRGLEEDQNVVDKDSNQENSLDCNTDIPKQSTDLLSALQSRNQASPLPSNSNTSHVRSMIIIDENSGPMQIIVRRQGPPLYRKDSF